VGRADVVQRLAVEQDERIPVDEATNPVGEQLGEFRDDGAAVAMADEDDVAQIRVDDRFGGRSDRLRMTDPTIDVTPPLAGQCRRMDIVPGPAQLAGNLGPRLTVVPGAVDEDEGAQPMLPSASTCCKTSFAIVKAEFAAGTPQ